MFFIISWRCVVKVEADIRMIRTTVRIFVDVRLEPRKVSEIGDPKRVALSACSRSSLVSGPIEKFGFWMLFSTRNIAKKIGAWSRIGRHEANGLVPVSLYRAMVSCVIF